MKKNHAAEGFSAIGASIWKRRWNLFLDLDQKLQLRYLPFAFLGVGLFFLLLQGRGLSPNIVVYQEAEIARSTVRSPVDIEIEDIEANAISKENFLSKIPLVFDYDPAFFNSWNEKWKSHIQLFRISNGVGGRVSKDLIEQKLGVSLSDGEFESLRNLSANPEFEKVSTFAFSNLWKQKIIDSRKVNLGPGGAEVVSLSSGRMVQVPANEFMGWMSVDEAKKRVDNAVQRKPGRRLGSWSFPWQRWKVSDYQNVKSVLEKMVSPNVTFNRKESEARRAQAMSGIKALVVKLTKGEVIVREGDKVTKKQEQVMTGLKNKLSFESKPAQRTWEWIYGSIVLWMLLFFVSRQFPQLLAKSKDALLLGTLLLMSFAIFKISVVFGYDVLAAHFESLPKLAFIFLIPFVAPAMISKLLLGSTYSVIFSILFSLGSVFIFEKSMLFGVLSFSNCLVGIMAISYSKTRTEFYRAGLLTALWCALGSVLVFKILNMTESGGGIVEMGVQPNASTWAWIVAGGFMGGLQSAILALAFTPILESILDYTTDLKLLELARMDHPLLKELVMKAPGTYHHSIVVGSLVEAGSEAIGANALLARVGSYYHDIGKIGRAEYFVENQVSGRNPHDAMKPQLSAKIIISHVKEGVEMARRFGLGQSMIDFIEQHHGRTLVNYFYNKAKQEAAQPGSSVSPEEIHEEDYRYPGPNPQTKEAAIMALADKCEAATRSLVDPTPARVEAIVHKVVMKSLEEGLLAEADITLKELHQVERAFLRILLGIYHSRIQYPDQEKGLPQAVPLSIVSGGSKS